VIEHRSLYIDGKWLLADGDAAMDVVSPSTEEVVARVPAGTAGDVGRAVAAARRSFDEGTWRRTPPAERGAILRRLADELRARSEELAQLITTESGSPISFSRVAQVGGPVNLLPIAADLAEAFAFEEQRQGAYNLATVIYEPVGVVAAISAWNGPLYLMLNKVAPALAAGCSVVMKPAAESPLDAFVLAEAADAAGVPAGVLNLVSGGPDTGRALVAHPDVDMVAFTGSDATGQAIMAAASETMKRVTLELGGKSPAVVLDDVDVASMLPVLVPRMTMGTGQVCILLSRLLVPADRHDEIVEAVCEGIAGIPIGDPHDESTALGPVITARHRDRIESYVAGACAEGAKIALGGGRPPGLDRGWFVEPTVLVGVEPDHRVAREEVFGPVIAVLAYDTEDDAVALANDTDYGLGAAVFTGDRHRGASVARRLRTGIVGVNAYTIDPGLPFGGFKRSGFGREGGREGLLEYLEPRTMIVA
jgi:aldehyde dehydrogenase (NAD+)